MKRIFLIVMILAPIFVWAQTEQDMLDFSTVYYQGTAKSAAMGNAIGAVGSDFSAITINPAGLALSRKAYFYFTPEFYAVSTNSRYQENNGFDRSFKLPVNNIGLSWTQKLNEGALNSVSFALGINRMNNYAKNSYANGNNPNTSLIDAYFSELEANGITDDYALEDYSPNGIFPLWETYLIDFNDDGTCSTLVPAGGLNQQYGVSKRGSAKEFNLASGFNLNDKVFLGLALNIPYFDKKTSIEYKERNLYSDNAFKNWSQSEYVANSGIGINAKIGAIVYPAKWIRLGIAFHTPSLYNVTESWFTETKSLINDTIRYYDSPVGTYEYTMTTPYRMIASAAFIFGNYGMITGDYEFVDYSKMRVSSYDYDYSSFNNYISDLYKSTSNIRIGTEWRCQTLAFRAGYAIYGSPFGFNDENLRTTSYSCGLGYTYHNFTIDATYVLSQRRNTYDMYSNYSKYPAYYINSGNESVVDDTKIKETTKINQIVISFKFRLD